MQVPLPPPIFATLDTDGDGGARTADADRCKEELGALRNLATELHAALRRSEDENAVLKGIFSCTYTSFLPLSAMQW